MTLLEADPKEIKKNYGSTFYWTLKFLNNKSISNVSMLYAFYRYAQDIASLPNKSSAKEMLGKFEEELDAPSHTFMARLSQIFERLNIKKMYAKEIISAARFDLSDKKIQHQHQLIVYCYKSAGAFGLMVAPALGVRDSSALPFALDLGIAASLTRICRNVLSDAKAKKVFFPETDLNESKLDLKELSSQGETPEGLKKLVEKYLSLADSYYSSALSGISYLPLRARFGVLLAIRLYQNIGSKIRRMDCEVLKGQIFLSGFEKAAVCLKTSAETLRPRFWMSGKHRDFLHLTLLGLPGVVVSKGVKAE